MEYVKLGNSDMLVSRLCMGGCPLGRYGWGDVPIDGLKKAIEDAIQNGINFFDTADTYGLGESERIIGESIFGIRNKVIVATKFGVRVEKGKTFYDNSSQWICQALFGSLERINTDYIDLFQIHYRDKTTSLIEIVETLDGLKEKGYIRQYGLSNITMDDYAEIELCKDKFVSFQNEYSLACRKNELDIIALSDKDSLTPVTWGSLGQGILTGKYDQNSKFPKDDRRSKDIYVNFHGEKLMKNLRIVDELKNIAISHRVTPAAVAIRWILDQLPKSIVIAGMKNSKQVKSNLLAFGWCLTEEELQKLNYISGE